MFRWIFSVCLLFVICSSCVDAKEYHHKLAVVAIFQNEARFLKEWLEYYQMLGVERFYLYNNLSTDHFRDVLEPYIEKRVVKLIDWPYSSNNEREYENVQCCAYCDALHRVEGKVKWLAIIDIDEFIVPKKVDSLKELLKPYEKKKNLGGVCIKWVFFGTSGVEKIDENDLMIETLLLNGGEIEGDFMYRVTYKSVIRPERVKKIKSAHFALYKENYHPYPVDFDNAQINHYWTRDEHFFYQTKIARRKVWGNSVDRSLNMAEEMTHNNSLSLPILRFIPTLCKRMEGNH